MYMYIDMYTDITIYIYIYDTAGTRPRNSSHRELVPGTRPPKLVTPGTRPGNSSRELVPRTRPPELAPGTRAGNSSRELVPGTLPKTLNPKH